MSGAANPVMTIDPSQEDQDKLAEFESNIANGVLIEPGDWMPQAYRVGMLRLAEHPANSEIVGALPEGEWITRAPSLRRKLALTAKVQDEVGHGQMLYRVSQDLGKSREDMLRDLCTGKTKYHNCFNYPAPTWGDIAMIQWLIDGAAIMNQKTLADGAYGPYVRTMHRINMEEAFHFKSGEDMVLTLMSGTKAQKEMTQGAFDRWWPISLMFFGPADKPDAENGVRILGTPLGTPAYAAAHAAERLAEEKRLLAELPELPDLQCAWLLLYFSAAARANPLLRVVPPEGIANYAKPHDDEVWATLCSLLHVDPKDPEVEDARDLGTLPMRLGGLGLRDARRTSPAPHQPASGSQGSARSD